MSASFWQHVSEHYWLKPNIICSDEITDLLVHNKNKLLKNGKVTLWKQSRMIFILCIVFSGVERQWEFLRISGKNLY